jgi:hypothetical protein
MTMVTFPIGATGGVSFTLQEAVYLAANAAEMIDHLDKPFEVLFFLRDYRVGGSRPLLDQFDFTGIHGFFEQLMTGFAISYPHRVNSQKVREVLTENPFSHFEVSWGSSGDGEENGDDERLRAEQQVNGLFKGLMAVFIQVLADGFAKVGDAALRKG